ncbi:glycoside hydrolase family 25 protein [Amycolatopsis sp. NPDC101161]|uniref:glycoside hydrolase family 25 protein n=1 Tax=Amycolatopsis sp. NPDC101161 TaxID=3363940 RepID=UPI003817BC73
MTRGADVHPFYQRGLRWDQVSDLAFVWVKVSDGGAPYTRAEGGVVYRPDTHVAGAKSRGIPVGGYHYAQLTLGPEAQADLLLAEVRRLGATGVAPMLDLEAPFRPDSAARAFGTAFCRRVAAAGLRPAVYMSASFAAALRPDQWDVPDLVIVIARYGARPEAPGAGRYPGRYDVHQYTSSGSLPGSAGAVDFDESYTGNQLDPEGDMPFSNDDFVRMMWGNTFDAAGNRNYAQFIKDMDAKITALGSSLDAVTKLITDSPANPVDSERLAAALEGKLVAELVPAVTEAVTQAAGAETADEVRRMLVGRLGAPA